MTWCNNTGKGRYVVAYDIHVPSLTCPRPSLSLETVQDFLTKFDMKPLDMKPCMHLVKISIFSLNLAIVRLTKIMKRADKNWAQF